MKQIGRKFFQGISNYEDLVKDFEVNLESEFIGKQRIDEDSKKGILVLSYLTKDLRMLFVLD